MIAALACGGQGNSTDALRAPGCQSDLACRGDRVCENGSCVDPATTDDDDGDTSDDDAVADDDGGTVEDGNATGNDDIRESSVACPFPESRARAEIIEGSGAESYLLSFHADGALALVANEECSYLGKEPERSWCRYDCGGCVVNLYSGSPEGEEWVISLASSDSDCSEINGAYNIVLCDSCADRECGEDGCGVSCGTCPTGQPIRYMCAAATGRCFEDPCMACVRDCPAGANCCTCGETCYCGDACFATCP